jgi:CrcB protein
MPWMIFAVAIGGAVGAVLRYCSSYFFAGLISSDFPFLTLIVNVAGSLVMGLCAAWFISQPNDVLKALVMTGVLGGFTTFSAFSLDFYTLWERGDMVQACVYVGGSVILSIVMLFAGLFIGRSFV